MFEPSAVGAGPSGLADWPRPFVFRAAHLDGLTVAPGSGFHFEMNLFDLREPAIDYLAAAFDELARAGLGPGRGRAKMIDRPKNPSPLVLPLDPESAPVDHVRVRFRTPTELKSGGRDSALPEFGTLAARIRDRLSTLRELYGDGPLPIDFRAFGERASRVRMTRCEIEHVDIARRSSRTGRTHSIGGFIGEAEYHGDLTEFVPYLRAAQWTGVGRQTVWGKGEIQLL